MAVSSVEFLTRAGCHLCDEARRRLTQLARPLRIDVVDVDVDAHPELAAEFGARVPVIRSRDGQVLAEGRITTAAVAAALMRVRRRGDGRPGGRH